MHFFWHQQTYQLYESSVGLKGILHIVAAQSVSITSLEVLKRKQTILVLTGILGPCGTLAVTEGMQKWCEKPQLKQRERN